VKRGSRYLQEIPSSFGNRDAGFGCSIVHPRVSKTTGGTSVYRRELVDVDES
jgi:hypothetical protein